MMITMWPLIIANCNDSGHNRNFVRDAFEGEYLIDCRFTSSIEFFEFIKPLLKDSLNQRRFRLLANWPMLISNNAATSDEFSNLREIQNWCENDNRFDFEILDTDCDLEIESILERITPRNDLFYFFVEGDLRLGAKLEGLRKLLLQSGNGLEGIVDKHNIRIFVSYANAISTSMLVSGSTYKNMEQFFGVRWSAFAESFENRPSWAGRSFPLRFSFFILHNLRALARVKSPNELRDLIQLRLKIFTSNLSRKLRTLFLRLGKFVFRDSKF